MDSGDHGRGLPSCAASRHWRLAAAALAAPATPAAAQAWEPTKPVQFIIPAGTGGGADQMARFIQGVVAKNNLMKQPLIVVNKGGGAGAEGFLEVKKSRRRPTQHHHHAVEPVHHAARDRRAVQLEGHDAGRRCWRSTSSSCGCNAETPYKTAKDYIDAVKAGDDKTFKMGGTGSKQEDQIITVALEKLTAPKKFTYVPYGGGDGRDPAGRQARQLDASTTRSRRSRSGRPARCGRCASSTPSAASYTDKVTATMAWSDIPTCKEIGRRHRVPDAARHLHGARRQARAGRLLRRPVQEGDGDRRLEGLHGAGRLQPDLHVGRDQFKTWVAAADKLHYDLMKEAGFLAK